MTPAAPVADPVIAPTDVAPVEVAPTLATLPTFTTEGDRERVDPIWYPCDEGQIKGNIDSDIYHTPDGLSYAFTFKNVICFDTPTAAIDAGFRAAER